MSTRWKAILTSPVDHRIGSLLAGLFTLIGGVLLAISEPVELISKANFLGLGVSAFVAIQVVLLLAAGLVCVIGYRGLRGWFWLWYAMMHPALKLAAPGPHGPGTANFTMGMYAMSLVTIGAFFVDRLQKKISEAEARKKEFADAKTLNDSGSSLT